MDHPRHPPCNESLPICHPLNDLHRSLHPIIPPLTVLDRLSTWKIVHSQRPTLLVPVLAVLPSSTCSPGPCRLLQPRTVRPFLMPLPLSGRPPFSALDVASIPVNPCGLALIGYTLSPQLLETLLPPAGLDLRPGPCWSWGGSCLQLLVYCPPPPCFLFTCSCSALSLCVYW